MNSATNRGVEPYVGNRNVNIFKARVIEAASYESTDLVVNGTATFNGDATFNSDVTFDVSTVRIGDGGLSGSTLRITDNSTMVGDVGSSVDLSGADFNLPTTNATSIAPGKIFFDTVNDVIAYYDSSGVLQNIDHTPA